MKVDIVKIKQAVKDGEIKAYVKDGKIYLSNDIGECVDIGEKNKDDIDPICKVCEHLGDIKTCRICAEMEAEYDD